MDQNLDQRGGASARETAASPTSSVSANNISQDGGDVKTLFSLDDDEPAGTYQDALQKHYEDYNTTKTGEKRGESLEVSSRRDVRTAEREARRKELDAGDKIYLTGEQSGIPIDVIHISAFSDTQKQDAPVLFFYLSVCRRRGRRVGRRCCFRI